MGADAEWYHIRDGGAVGPQTYDELLESLDKGEITRQTLVRHAASTDWQPLEVALGLGAGQAPPIPPEPPTISPADSLIPMRENPAPQPHPWRRYFARMLDTMTNGALVFFLLGIVIATIDQDELNRLLGLLEGKPYSRFLDTMATLAIATIPNAVCIGFTGSSLGKLIFGVHVARADGAPIGFWTAFRREVMVYFRGFGLGIPLVSLITLIVAFQRLKADGITSWDTDLDLTVTYRDATTTQAVLNVIGVTLWLAIILALRAL